VFCLVRPAAEENEVVRRKDSYCRTIDRPGTGMVRRAPGLASRLPRAGDRRSV
jgi:hypothetical protein